MTKTEFVLELADKLSLLPGEEIEDRISFYVEMIDDRMEDGLSEEDAVAAVGSVDEIAAQIIDDIPFAKLVKEKMKPKKRLRAWEIVLIVIGSPLWLPLLVAAFAVLISLYISLWAVVISLWAVFVSFIVGMLGGIVAGIVFAAGGNIPAGVAMIGAGISLAGLAVFAFVGCKAVTKGIVKLAKKLIKGIKRGFMKKGEAC